MFVNSGYGHTVGTLQGLSLIPVAICRFTCVLTTLHAVPKTLHFLPKTVHFPAKECACCAKDSASCPRTHKIVTESCLQHTSMPLQLHQLPWLKRRSLCLLQTLFFRSCAWRCCACKEALHIRSVWWCKQTSSDRLMLPTVVQPGGFLVVQNILV